MASIDSIMGSGAAGSVYGNKNIISGLASGMDTESMIENAISGYKMRLGQLNQQRTKVEWQQSAYRSIISKMVDFNRKYTSFSSGNNLLSPSFFNNAIKIATHGANADKISASGRTSSDITIDSVTSLASTSRYTIGGGNFVSGQEANAEFDIVGGEIKTGTLKGSLTLGYGGKRIEISFDEKDTFETAEQMAEAINKKLADHTIAFNGGIQDSADHRIKAVVAETGNGKKEIQFQKANPADGNSIWIDSVSGNVEEKLGISTAGDDQTLKAFTFEASKMTSPEKLVDILNKKGFEITFNGVTKTIKGPGKDELGENWDKAKYMELFQKKVNEAFGTHTENSGEVPNLKVTDIGTGSNIKLKFESSADNKFFVSSSAGKHIGMENGLSSFINTKRTLGDLMAGKLTNDMRLKASGDVTADAKDANKGVDEAGNTVVKEGDAWYRVDKDGKNLYDFQVNGKSVGAFTEESSLKEMLDKINSSENSDVNVAYSEFTDRFTFTSKDSGSKEISFGNTGLAHAMFGGDASPDAPADKKADYTLGHDAEFKVTVNGVSKTVKGATNTFDIDGLKITLKDTFAESSEKVSFTSSSDADKIVKAVKEMVDDYNAMAKEIKSAYSTMPMQNSKGKYYEPLTDEQRKDMSESEIKSHEEKAKTGLLFADRDLSNLYDGLRNSLNVLGATGNDANKLGLTSSFENGTTTISFDENQFRKALEQDPDKVRDIFTSSKLNGNSSDGLMQSMKTQLDRYANTMGASKGILIEKAGSPEAPTSIFQNTLQNKIGDLDKRILSMQDLISNKIDYYNSKFTALEMMVAEMNNQSSMLMGLTGGY